MPYAPQAFALPGLLPLIDRKLYPAEQYPDGQWNYYRFYLTRFDQTVTDFNADIPASLAAIYRSGAPVSAGKNVPDVAVCDHRPQWRLVRFGASCSPR